MTKRSTALLLAVLLAGAGCRTKDPAPDPPKNPVSQLPAETRTGQGTFGCLLNGHAWTQAGSSLGGPLLSAQYFNRHLSLVANRNVISAGITTRETIQLDLDSIRTTGVYTLIRKDSSFVNYENLSGCNYYTDTAHPATVEITRLDPVARIVAGRFAFTLETPGCGKTTVTNGRFDCRF